MSEQRSDRPADTVRPGPPVGGTVAQPRNTGATGDQPSPEQIQETVRATYQTDAIKESNERYAKYHKERQDRAKSASAGSGTQKVTLKERVSSGVVIGNVGDTVVVTKPHAEALKAAGIVDDAGEGDEAKSYRPRQNKAMQDRRPGAPPSSRASAAPPPAHDNK